MLEPREQDVLKAIVEDYIETAEPVPSRTLVDKYKLPVSSATIRNTMADLEERGYLEKPHTSAGRIPSDLGYREYIEHLMPRDSLSLSGQREIVSTLNPHFSELTDLLRSAVWVLSEGTGYTSLAVSPRLARNSLQQIKMLMIEPGRVLIVIVLSAGLVKDKIVRMPDNLNQQVLVELSSIIEQRLGGIQLKNITLVTVQSSLSDSGLPDSLLNQVAYEAYTAIKQADNLETYVDGVPNLFQHREFQSVNKASSVINALKDDGLLIGLLEPAAAEAEQVLDEEETSAAISVTTQPRFMIRIGQELQQDEFTDCSFVAAACRLPGRTVGSIGVIGPKRMQYQQVISHISFLSQTLEGLVETDNT